MGAALKNELLDFIVAAIESAGDAGFERRLFGEAANLLQHLLANVRLARGHLRRCMDAGDLAGALMQFPIGDCRSGSDPPCRPDPVVTSSGACARKSRTGQQQ